MDKFKEIEIKLNKEKVPLYFHDMSIVNMRFNGDKIEMRLLLAKYLDDFNILEDDKHFAILEVVYEGIIIKKMFLEGLLDFRNSDIISFNETENGMIYLFLMDDQSKNYFLTEFSTTKYKWKIVDIITQDEYYDSIVDYVEYIENLEENEEPEWRRFNELMKIK